MNFQNCNMNFIAIDFETANMNRSSICSLGVAIVENGKLMETDHFYIKPTPDYYDDFNTHLHGISDYHTRDKKTFRQQWPQLKSYFNNRTIVAHNAAFDCGILRYTLDVSDLSYPDLDYYCTFRLSQAALSLPAHKLSDVSRHFNIQLKHHNAESDARASALIALKLCEQVKVESLETLGLKFGFRTGKIISETKSYKAFSARK
jgi:DNA polymerase-3 subunit epsilon